MAPDNPAFKAMEKDLNERASRAEGKRQAAHRWKEKGNAALKAGQPADALRCYELGAQGLTNTRRGDKGKPSAFVIPQRRGVRSARRTDIITKEPHAGVPRTSATRTGLSSVSPSLLPMSSSGLEAEKRSIELHSNATMAALKMGSNILVRAHATRLFRAPLPSIIHQRPTRPVPPV